MSIEEYQEGRHITLFRLEKLPVGSVVCTTDPHGDHFFLIKTGVDGIDGIFYSGGYKKYLWNFYNQDFHYIKKFFFKEMKIYNFSDSTINSKLEEIAETYGLALNNPYEFKTKRIELKFYEKKC